MNIKLSIVLSLLCVSIAACKSDSSTDSGDGSVASQDAGTLDASGGNHDASASDDATTATGDATVASGDATVVTADAGGDSTVADDEITTEEFAAAAANLYCDHPEKFDERHILFWTTVFRSGDRATCVARATTAIQVAIEYFYLPSINGGQVTYDGRALYTCMNEFAASTSIAVLGEVPWPCETAALAPARSIGETCQVTDWQLFSVCEPGSVCVTGDSRVCGGTCVATAPAGTLCDDSTLCDPGSRGGERGNCTYATGSTTTRYCYTNKRTLVGEGQPCGRSVTNDETYEQEQFDCNIDTYCKWSAMTPTCQPRLAAGSDCDSEDMCAIGTRCDRDTAKCVAGLPSVVSTVGATCDSALCDVSMGLICAEDDISHERACQLAGTTVDSPCGGGMLASLADTSCGAGLYCDREIIDDRGGKCRAKSGLDESCRDDDSCVDGLICDSDSRTCKTFDSVCGG